MNEHTQLRDADKARHAASARGRHLGSRVRTPILAKVSAGVVAAVAAVALVLTMTAAPSGRSQAHPTAVRLTAREVSDLQRLTPAQRQRVGAKLDAVFSRLGMQAGIGEPGRAAVTGPQLAAYEWSGGVTCCEAWVKASYANLRAAMNRFHTHAALLNYLTIAAAAVTDGIAAVICAVLAGGIVLMGKRAGKFAAVRNHGVWFGVWWMPPHVQGGHW